MRDLRLELEYLHWQDSVTGDINTILKIQKGRAQVPVVSFVSLFGESENLKKPLLKHFRRNNYSLSFRGYFKKSK